MAAKFGFPYDEPYAVQSELMEQVYSTIQNKAIAFLESPTGTGKTLSMLCAALHWLQEKPEALAQVPSLAQSSSEPKWLQQMRLERDASKPREAEVLVSGHSAKRPRVGGQRKLADIGLDAKIASLVRALDDDPETAGNADSSPANNFGYQYRSRKVFYCSRTHSQLAQVMAELRKTAYFRDRELALTLGSRKNLCINPKVMQAASPEGVNDLCQETLESETGCPFYNRAKHAAFGEFLRFSEEQHSLDFEDMTRLGRGSGCCSYFASRYLLNPASFAAVPYNTILDRRTRESYGIDLKGSVVIFDEAHNIVDFVSQMDSACLPNANAILDVLSSSLSEYRSKFFSRLSGASNSSLSQLLLAIERIRSHLKTALSPERTYTVNAFLHAAQIDGINFVKLAEYIQESRLFKKIADQEQVIASSANSLVSFFTSLGSLDQDGRLIWAEGSLKYVCLDPRNVMRDVLNECHAVIFCGGTMSPVEGIVSALTDDSMNARIVCRSFSHVVRPENLQVSILQQGPSKIKFDFTFESRNDGKLIMELGVTICNLARVVPRGLVVFFTSFAYLDVVAEVWQQKGLIQSLSAVKKLFVEKRGVGCDQLLSDYEEAVHKEGGALLLAVMNGKLSEGINFSDALGRGIVVVGLPFPNATDIELKQRIEAHVRAMQAKKPHLDALQIQSEYLDNVCMRIVNQTIGRAIRHKNDYAAVYLIDQRFLRKSIQTRLSKWILQSLLQSPTDGSFGKAFKDTVAVWMIGWVCRMAFTFVVFQDSLAASAPD